MSGDLKVGDLVVCVDDTPKPRWQEYLDYYGLPYPLPKLGSHYTVIWTGACSEGPGVIVDGVMPVGDIDGKKYYHGAERYRKIPKEDDEFTELMKRMKNKVKEKVDS